MQHYYINLRCDSNGYNEVHEKSCVFLQIANSKEYLGYFGNAIEAVSYAKRNGYPNADGCYYCSGEAHHI